MGGAHVFFLMSQCVREGGREEGVRGVGEKEDGGVVSLSKLLIFVKGSALRQSPLLSSFPMKEKGIPIGERELCMK